MMSRKGPWEGYRRQAKQGEAKGEARCLLPAFLCARERDVWVRGRDTTITDNLPCFWAKKVVLTFSPDSARLIRALSVAPWCPYQRSLTVKVMSHGTIRNDDF